MKTDTDRAGVDATAHNAEKLPYIVVSAPTVTGSSFIERFRLFLGQCKVHPIYTSPRLGNR